MTCDGKAVPIAVPSEDEPGPPEYVIPIEKGMTCQFTVTVINHSGHAVRVKDMTFPALMPGHGNAGPMIVTGNDSAQKPHGRDGDLAATFDVDETVPPDESIGVELRLLTNPNACNSPGTAGLGDLPSTRIVVLHRQLTVHGQMAIAVKIKKALDGPTCASSS
jgi:hypothetical protein